MCTMYTRSSLIGLEITLKSYSLILRSLHYLKSEIHTVIDERSVMLYRARSKMFRTPFKLLAISSIGIHSFFQKYEFLLRIRMEITDFISNISTIT